MIDYSIVMTNILQQARQLNEKKYHQIIGFYGVSYISDYCINDCLYCGDRKSNSKERKRLSLEEFEMDLDGLLMIGHKAVCFLTGEDPQITTENLIEYLKIVQSRKLEEIILNIPPKSTEDFKKIRQAINLPLQFRVFQETYNREIYLKQHPCGPKSDYFWRLESQARALTAGFDDVGVGALMGLNPDSNEEIERIIEHAERIYGQFRKYPKTLSIPRIQRAEGNESYKIPAPVDDEDYILLNAQLRLALPETQIIITGRESAEMRRKLRPYINIETLEERPGPGGNYLLRVTFQNEVQDKRKAKEILSEIKREGFKPNIKHWF